MNERLRYGEAAAIPIGRRPNASRTHLKEWVRRYGVAELVGLAAAITAAFVGLALTGSEIAAAYVGALGEGAGFYLTMIMRELAAERRIATASRRSYGPREIYRTAASLLVEFGPAEVADWVFRPFAMSVGIHVLGFHWGIVAGKLIADLAFYIPVISAHDLRHYLTRARLSR